LNSLSQFCYSIGNGIKGTLSESIVINSKFNSLSLSNNQFRGDVPLSILERSWAELNLGFNKFSGQLSNKIPYVGSNSIFNLQGNRLSGPVPSTLYNASNISILIGNIFQCPWVNSYRELPRNNKDVDQYQCGSNNFNISIISSIIFSFVIIIIKTKMIIYEKSKKIYIDNENDNKTDLFSNSSTFYHVWIKYSNMLRILDQDSTLIKMEKEFNKEITKISSLKDNNMITNESNISVFLKLIERLNKTLLFISILLLVWIPISFILTINYSMFEYSYSFIVSLLYLGGYVPAIILIILMNISIILIFYIMKQNFHVLRKENIDDRNQSLYKIQTFALSLVVLINVIILIGINSFYVYSTLTFTKTDLILVEICIAVIKTLWKSIILPKLIKMILEDFFKSSLIDDKSQYIVFQCALGVVNEILIPYFATALINPNCFYYTLKSQPSISSSYTYLQSCDSYSFQNSEESTACISNGGIDQHIFSNFNPPFTYNYQCSSTIISSYTNIYLYMSVLMIITPTIILLSKKCISKIVSLLNQLRIDIFEKIGIEANDNSNENNDLNHIVSNNDETNSNSFFRITENLKDEQNMNEIIFDKDYFIINVVSYMIVAVTIGIVVPVVGLFICLSIYLFINIILVNLGIKISETINDDEKLILKKKIENNCQRILEPINISLNYLMLPLMGFVFSLFIFDIMGDAIGESKSIWTIFLMNFFPLLILFCSYILKDRITLNSNNNNSKTSNEDNLKSTNVELFEIINPLRRKL
jgi:hypothetical protein